MTRAARASKTLERQQGFTLIELLVVVAIIGLLAAVVLAAVNTARAKGADAAIEGDLHGVATEAALDNNSICYANFGGGTTCSTPPAAVGTAAGGKQCNPTAFAVTTSIFGDTIIQNAINNAVAAAGGNASQAACAASAGGFAYAVVVQMRSNTSKVWCVDSTGYAGALAYSGGALTSCLSSFACLQAGC